MKQQSIISAFMNAFNGLFYFLRDERNGRIQIAATILVIVFAILFDVSRVEWLVILLCIGSVLSLEMINSAVEKLCDLITKDYNPIIKTIKDVSAGAVLLASGIGVFIACIIFLPKIILLL